MEIRLGESIRRLRKEAGYTQEQLAEALGVTTGAVHKWESGKATPELEMLVDIAEFFETSVDALLNYGWQKLSMGQTVEKLRQFYEDKKLAEGMRFAEKALQKYPNSFDIVLQSALVYFLTLKPEHMPRAVELYEKAITLADQKENGQLYAMSIQNRIAICYTYMDKMEDAVQILNQYNLNGMNNTQIGLLLSKEPKKAELALGYLSDALCSCYSELFNLCIGYANAYESLGKLEQLQNLIFGVYEFGNRLRKPGVINWMDRVNVCLFLILAEIECLRGDEQKACEWLRKAKETAQRFDAAPEYHTGVGIPFYYGSDKATSYGDMGDTAMEMIQRHMSDEAQGRTLRPIWEKI